MRLRSLLTLTLVLAVAGVLYVVTRPEPEVAPRPKPPEYVWYFEMDELEYISIELPRTGQADTWTKHEDRLWYFDEPGEPRVDMYRWGGGIPLILSGPAAERPIERNATDERLEAFGFLPTPKMVLSLTKDDGEVIRIEVGDSTPDTHAYYVRRHESRSVYTVDATWYQVLERLLLQPPYPPPYIWGLRLDDFTGITISLPALGKTTTMTCGEAGRWHRGGTDVTSALARSFPLIPDAEKAQASIRENATASQLENYGLSEPVVTLEITGLHDKAVKVEMGKTAPDGRNVYIRLAGSSSVYQMEAARLSDLIELAFGSP